MKATLDLRTVTANDFEPHVGHSVKLIDGEDSKTLVLNQCAEYCHDKTTDDRTPFFLTLISDDLETIGQGNYVIEFPKIGALNLFMVPVGSGKHQITFN